MYEAHLPPEYVLDKMQVWEIDPLLRHCDLGIRTSWEQARLNAYMVAQANSTKRLAVTDIIHFPWDDARDESSDDTRMSNEDLTRLRKQAQEYLEKHG